MPEYPPNGPPAARAWEQATGGSTEAFYEELDRVGGSTPLGEEGEFWDFDDDEEMARRLPRLSKRFLEEG